MHDAKIFHVKRVTLGGNAVKVKLFIHRKPRRRITQDQASAGRFRPCGAGLGWSGQRIESKETHKLWTFIETSTTELRGASYKSWQLYLDFHGLFFNHNCFVKLLNVNLCVFCFWRMTFKSWELLFFFTRRKNSIGEYKNCYYLHHVWRTFTQYIKTLITF